MGVLAESFLAKHLHSPQGTIAVIDVLAQELGVERRRIYDVVNILEAVKLVVKRGKNTYHWMGTGHLPTYFAILQREALHSLSSSSSLSSSRTDTNHDEEEDEEDGATGQQTSSVSSNEKNKNSNKKKKNNNNSKKRCKSLSRLSQQFLQVFLVGNPIVSLADASDKIHGTVTSLTELATLGARGIAAAAKTTREPEVPMSTTTTQGMKTKKNPLPKDPEILQRLAARGLKTKIRRLYDIANVLSATGFLAKVDDPPPPTMSSSSSSSPMLLLQPTTTTPGVLGDSSRCVLMQQSLQQQQQSLQQSSCAQHRRPYYKWVFHHSIWDIQQIGQTIPLDQTCPFTTTSTTNNCNRRSRSNKNNNKKKKVPQHGQQQVPEERALSQLHPTPNHQPMNWNPLLPRKMGGRDGGGNLVLPLAESTHSSFVGPVVTASTMTTTTTTHDDDDMSSNNKNKNTTGEKAWGSCCDDDGGRMDVWALSPPLGIVAEPPGFMTHSTAIPTTTTATTTRTTLPTMTRTTTGTPVSRGIPKVSPSSSKQQPVPQLPMAPLSFDSSATTTARFIATTASQEEEEENDQSNNNKNSNENHTGSPKTNHATLSDNDDHDSSNNNNSEEENDNTMGRSIRHRRRRRAGRQPPTTTAVVF